MKPPLLWESLSLTCLLRFSTVVFNVTPRFEIHFYLCLMLFHVEITFFLYKATAVLVMPLTEYFLFEVFRVQLIELDTGKCAWEIQLVIIREYHCYKIKQLCKSHTFFLTWYNACQSHQIIYIFSAWHLGARLVAHSSQYGRA